MNESSNFNALVTLQLQISKQLQALTNKIHATADIDEIMLELSGEICDLFGCERLTIYAVGEDMTTIHTKVKTGLDSFDDFSLPISEASIAGYAVLYKRTINLRDVYDQAELAAHTPKLQFVRLIDERTGYRARELLCAPILGTSRDALGVIQLINNRVPGPFSPLIEEGAQVLCATLALAFAQRLRAPVEIRGKYDPLVAHALLTLAELGLAARAAKRKGLDIEDVLISEFGIRRSYIGLSLAEFHGVPYEPFRPDRIKPNDALVCFERRDVESDGWLPLEVTEQDLLVMTIDPERVMASGRAEEIFPGLNVRYCVTSNAEYRQTIEQFFGGIDQATAAKKSNWDFDAIDNIKAVEQAAAARVHDGIAAAFAQDAYADVSVAMHPQEEKTSSRFRKDGSLESIRGSILVDYLITFPATPAENCG